MKKYVASLAILLLTLILPYRTVQAQDDEGIEVPRDTGIEEEPKYGVRPEFPANWIKLTDQDKKKFEGRDFYNYASQEQLDSAAMYLEGLLITTLHNEDVNNLSFPEVEYIFTPLLNTCKKPMMGLLLEEKSLLDSLNISDAVRVMRAYVESDSSDNVMYPYIFKEAKNKINSVPSRAALYFFLMQQWYDYPTDSFILTKMDTFSDDIFRLLQFAETPNDSDVVINIYAQTQFQIFGNKIYSHQWWLDNYERAIDRNDTLQIVNTCLNIANFYFNFKDYDQTYVYAALGWSFSGYELSKNLDEITQIKSRLIAAQIRLHSKQYLEKITSRYDVFGLYNTCRLLDSTLNNENKITVLDKTTLAGFIGDYFFGLGRYRQAILFYKECLIGLSSVENFKYTNPRSTVFHTLTQIQKCAALSHDTILIRMVGLKANGLHVKLIDHLQYSRQSQGFNELFILGGQLAYSLNDMDNSIRFLELALSNLGGFDNEEPYETLIKAYKNKGRYSDALALIDSLELVKEQIKSQIKMSDLAELRANEDRMFGRIDAKAVKRTTEIEKKLLESKLALEKERATSSEIEAEKALTAKELSEERRKREKAESDNKIKEERREREKAELDAALAKIEAEREKDKTRLIGSYAIIGVATVLIFGLLFFILLTNRKNARIAEAQRLAEQEKANKMLAEKQKLEIENKYLSARISKHFLYNILDKLDPNTDVPVQQKAHIHEQFTYFLDELLKKEGAKETLHHELKTISSYLYLRKQYENIEYEIKYEKSDSEKIFVPYLFLLEIIDNAIRHGIRSYAIKEGAILIELIKNSNKEYLLRIKDNGGGFNEKKEGRQGTGLISLTKRIEQFNAENNMQRIQFDKKTSFHNIMGNAGKIIGCLCEIKFLLNK